MSDSSDTADQDAIQRQQELLAKHRERLAILLGQYARFGTHTPPHVIIEIREAQATLRPIKAWLRTKGILITDQLDDDAQVTTEATPPHRSSDIANQNNPLIVEHKHNLERLTAREITSLGTLSSGIRLLPPEPTPDIPDPTLLVRPRKLYRLNTLKRESMQSAAIYLLMFSFFCGILSIGPLINSNNLSRSDFDNLFISLIFIIPTLSIGIYNLRVTSKQVLIYFDRLEYEFRTIFLTKRTITLPWSKIEEVLLQVNSTSDIVQCSVIGQGKSIDIPIDIGYIEDLYRTILHETLRYQLPNIIARYNAGQSLEFGPLAVNQQELLIGMRRFRWSNIIRIYRDTNKILLVKNGEPSVYEIGNVSNIPNYLVFLELAQRIISQHIPTS